MATRIYMFGEGPLWSGRGVWTDVHDLQRDLNDLLQEAGEVIWDGDEHRGPAWNVDLLLYGPAPCHATTPAAGAAKAAGPHAGQHFAKVS
jgi:hypothetical protein